MRSRTHLPVLILLGVCSSALAAEPKHDRHGDPLPDGAIARLGSLRLRNEAPFVDAGFTADAKALIVCDNKFISFWDPITGKRQRRVQIKHVGQVWRLCLSGDGKTLVLNSNDNLLRFVDPATGAERHTLNFGQRGFLSDLLVSGDGKIVASLHQTSLALWDAAAGKLLHEIKGPPVVPYPSSHNSIALAPDGKQLVLPRADGSLHLLEVATGKELHSWKLPPLRPGMHPSQRALRMAFSPNGQYFAFGGLDTPLTVCELSSGKRLQELALPRGTISGLAFTPNGRFLAVDDYTRIRLFGVLSGKELHKLPLTSAMRNHNQLIFSPDGRTLAFLNDHTIDLWDSVADRRLHPRVGHESWVRSLAFFPDGQRLVSADFTNDMRIWDIATGRTLSQRRNNTPCESLIVDRDDESVRFAGFDFTAHRWEPRTGRENVSSRMGFGLSTNNVALSPDGRSLAAFIFMSAGQGRPATRELRVYDVKTSKSIVLPGLAESSWVSHLQFTPDSIRFAAIGQDGTLRLWDRNTGKLLRELRREAPSGQPMRLAFASDGRSAALLDNVIRIREVASGVDRLRVPPVPGQQFALAYSPNARFLACGQDDGRILVYSAVSGKQLAQWQGNQGYIHALTFSRDSRYLASGGANGIILVWEVPKDAALPASLKTEEADSLWKALGDSDAAAANRALASLAAAPAHTLPLFEKQLQPIGKSLDHERLARLIAELDDDSFQVRQRATRELALIGSDAAEALRQALLNGPSAESRRRIEDLLSHLKKDGDSPRLRFLRALEVLERIGSPQAKALLRSLAGKSLPAEWHEEVQSSLRRLGDTP
jgi:WD40 repeat protein